MKNFFFKSRGADSKKKLWTILIIIAAVIILFIFIGHKKNNKIDLVTAQKRNIVEEVSVTGNVKPFSDLDLSFELGGQISRVNVLVGDKVYQGKYLASLSNGDLAAAVEQAKAGLKIAQANLSSLKNGATPEQIAVNQSQVEKATNDLANAKISLVNSIKDAYTKSDDAVRNYADLMINNPNSSNSTLQFATDFQLQNNILSERQSIETALTSWETSISNFNSNSDLNASIREANLNLVAIQTFLQNLAFAVNKLSPNSSISQTLISQWKANVSTARTSIDLAVDNFSSASALYQSAISSLNIANSQLTLTKTGATSDQLQALEATVEQAQADVDAAQANLDKTIIIAPIGGIVTNVAAKVGQTMQPGMSAISLISYGQYDVESYVPEADIAKIKIGDVATTTLDAYGSDTFFETSVIKIDPGETVIEGVPTYKVTLKFASSSDSRIKSGMTANLDILTEQKNAVLSVPSRSVYSVDIQKYVKSADPKNPNKITDIPVVTGIRGVDGYIEIISGLKEGDQIVASPNI
jgi:RND family efflux transporter MFP subunit